MTGLLAIADLFGDAERVGEMSTRNLLALGVILSWAIVIYQNRKSDKDRIAERLAQEHALSAFIAHHDSTVENMNTERSAVRASMETLITNNTAAMTQLKDTVQTLAMLK